MASGNSGQSSISTLLYLLVAVAIIYVVVKVVPPYMDYYAMEDEVSQQMQMSKINSAPVIRQDLMLKAKELEIDLKELQLTTDKGMLRITMAWSTTVDFGYGIRRDFEYRIDTAGTGAK